MNEPNMIRYIKGPMLLLCLFLFMAGGCRRSAKIFTLKGNLKNVTGEELYLLGTRKPFDRIDTIRLEKGKFRYEAETDTLLPLTLLFNQGATLPLFVDKGLEITIEGDALQPDSIRITGGEANEELNRFNMRIRNVRDSVALLAEADSFIRSHPFSQVSVYLLDRYYVQTPRPDLKRINGLIESMSGMLHDHPLILSLQKKLEDALKADTGRYVSNFRMRNRKGENLTSYHFRDKVLVLSFWATWNEPSLKMQEELKALRKRLKKEDIEFVYFALDMDKKRWQDAVRNDTLDGEHAYDGEGWESLIVKQFGIEKLPTVVVLTPQRKIVTKSADIRELTRRIEALLKQEKERKEALKKRTSKRR